MKSESKSLLVFLDGADKKFIVPIYQRNYVWSEKQCKRLWDDLITLSCLLKEDMEATHFFGTVYSKRDEEDNLVLIDGQQRITTVSLILIALYNAIDSNEISAIHIDKKEIKNKFLITHPNENKVRLQTFHDDQTIFRQLIFQDCNVEEIDFKSPIILNYNYFYKRILENKEFATEMLYKALEHLQIVDNKLENSESAQLIFENLNSTGCHLKESEKIKNFLLINLSQDTQEKLYSTYWIPIDNLVKKDMELFFRNYLTIKKSKILSEKELYEEYKSVVSRNPEEALKELLGYAKIYYALSQAELYEGKVICKVLVNDAAMRLTKLNMPAIYPFLMEYWMYAEAHNFKPEERLKVLKCVESLLFRRLICELQLGCHGEFFAELHKKAVDMQGEKINGASYYDALVQYIESNRYNITFPSDPEFTKKLTTMDIYSKLNKKHKVYLFERLENGDEGISIDVYKKMDSGILTIEHIMPQKLSAEWEKTLGSQHASIHKQWLHTLSNLTLSEHNCDLGNGVFADKKCGENGFLKSHLHLNQQIAKYEKWTENELKQRKQQLSEIAVKLWARPKSQQK